MRECTNNQDCVDSGCQECCPHDEHDHGECLDCGKDIMNRLIAEAEAAAEGER